MHFQNQLTLPLPGRASRRIVDSMRFPKKSLALVVLAVLLGSSAWVCVRFYSFVFAKTIHGEIVRVERVSQGDTIVANYSNATGSNATNRGSIPASLVFSFAVAIRNASGEIHTSSSEDRQWAVAQAGQCAEARFFRYPPWDLEKGGTYFGARLIRLQDCGKK